MSAPLPTGGAPLELQTWHELEDLFAQLSQLARSPVAPHEYYRTVLDQSVRALSAEGGAVWLRASDRSFQLATHSGQVLAGSAQDTQSQRSHSVLVAEVATNGHVATISPQSALKNSAAVND